MKTKLTILAIVLAAIFALGFMKNLIVQSALCAGISKAAKLPVRIGSTNFSFMKSSIDLRRVRVDNPSGFKDRLLMDAPQIAIDFEPKDLFKGVAHFELVSLDVREIVVVKDAKGVLNVDAMKPSKEEQAKQKQQEEERAKAEKKPSKKTKLQIDLLRLSIGKVTYRDYSGGGEPKVQVFEINLKNREYKNVDNPSAVVSLIMFEALTRTTLSRLAGLDMSLFKDGAMGAVSGGLGVVTDGAEGLENTAKNLLNMFN